MVTHLVKHITHSEGASPNHVLVSRAMGKVGGKVKPSLAYAELDFVYRVDLANGETPISRTTTFPSGKYEALDFTPLWDAHRFIGWFGYSAEPSASIPDMSGEVTSKSQVKFMLRTVYAHWQLPITVTFDATTNGGVMPDEWVAPHYYAGQSYGELPKPTHDSLSFTGWYDSAGNRITAASIVPEGGAILTARYTALSLTIDLNNQWQLSTTQSNPNQSLYDGVYESFSNKSIRNSYDKMYIRLIGYTNFRVYIRSYAEGNYDYTIAFNPDVDVTSLPSYTTTGAKASTRGKQNGGQTIESYTPVDYELDGGEHFIVIVYRKDSSGNSFNDQGYVLIPKEQ